MAWTLLKLQLFLAICGLLEFLKENFLEIFQILKVNHFPKSDNASKSTLLAQFRLSTWRQDATTNLP